MTIIDQIKALALEGYGAEDISVKLGKDTNGKPKVTRQEAWKVI